MWPTGYPRRRPAVRAPAAGPTGPATITLRSAAALIAAMIRCAGIAYIVVQVVIWHSFYTSAPWHLAGPALAAGWAGFVAVRLRGRPSAGLACLDCAVYAVLAVAAQACVPPPVRDDTFSWLVVTTTGELMVPAWYAPRLVSVPAALVLPAAYLVGALRQPMTDVRTTLGATALLLVTGVAHISASRVLYRRAATADAAVESADRAARERYAELSGALARREHERLVHDTVLNTLTALARPGAGALASAAGAGTSGAGASGAGAAVLSRCRQDVELLEAALRGSAGLTAGATDGRGDLLAGDLLARDLLHGDLLAGDLLAGVRAVADGMRARGLIVHLEGDVSVPSGVPAPAAPVPGVPVPAAPVPGVPVPAAPVPGVPVPAAPVPATPVPATPIPATVVTALTGATREALSNVAEHAGTGEAWVTVRRSPGRAQVTVRDTGAGFDPARAGQGRLGLRRSIAERVGECGGQASVRSAPGQGTEISLCWPGTGPALDGQPGAGAAVPGNALAAGDPAW